MVNYTAYHVHSSLSLMDSCTDFKLYIDRAKELGQTAIAITEHGKPLQWVSKKMYCDEVGVKYIHGVECYLTRSLLQTDPETGEMRKVRDNYHTVLLARDYDGVLEINRAISTSTDEEHTYYTNRITFDEFLRLSSHVIATSACLASPLNQLSMDDPWYEKLVRRYDFLELQPHACQEQIALNQRLAILAQKYRKPLIAGTDTHNLNPYKAECRQVLLDHRGQTYGNEDEFDLNYKTYDELVQAFRQQDAIPEPLWMEAIENTNVLADMVEDFELDTALKYPKLYGSSEADREKLVEVVYRSYQDKLARGVIPQSEKAGFDAALPEELRVFEKIDMSGYMLCMSELIRWCWANGIPVGPGRGSVGGSRVAYVTDIIDIDPERWGTIFSRFANEYRKEVGDIDVDVIDTDRPRIFRYLIDRFGQEHTARVPTWGTAAAANTIEIICMALRNRWEIAHDNPDGARKKKYSPNNPYSIKVCDQLKKQFASGLDKTKLLKDKKEQEYLANLEAAKNACPDVFYYFDGVYGSKVSQGIHAAGIVVSPITLQDNYGCFWKDGELVLNIDMEEIHECGLVKFDLLVLNNIGIIRDACNMAGIPYPKSHNIDFDDQKVWEDMMRSPVGIFQFEASYAHKMLRDYGAKSIFDMALVSAVNRPACSSFQKDLIAHKPHKNPSPIIDALLQRNEGYLCVEGTQLVNTRHGPVPIKDICIGDMVLTRRGYRMVTDARKTGHKPLIRVSYGGNSLLATPDHRILSNTGWTPCGALCPGDFVGVYTGGTLCGSGRSDDVSPLCGRLVGDGKVRWAQVTAIDEAPAADVYDITVAWEHEFVCQGIVTHNCFQEDTLRFLQEICGISGSDADNVRRAIGRKQKERLDEALPAILDGYCAKSDKPRETAEQEAKEFLQILEDSANYQFNYSHAVAYSIVGYFLAWLRCYYPGELIAAYLNRAKNIDDITNGTELAQLYGVAISPPRFEFSDAAYTYDRGTNTITKGIASLKGYGEGVCHKLHELGQRHYDFFVQALEQLYQNGIKLANIMPLISIDYFSSFGKIPELSRIATLFDRFRPGKIGGTKSVKREGVINTPLYEIVMRHGSDKTGKGNEAKNLTITDADGFLQEVEQYILGLGLPDVDLKTKMQNQKRVLGYVDLTTHKQEDRRNVMVLDVEPQKDKKSGSVWGYRIGIRSIGSGKAARVTVPADVFTRAPLREGDFIFAPKGSLKKNRKGFWYLYQYERLA